MEQRSQDGNSLLKGVKMPTETKMYLFCHTKSYITVSLICTMLCCAMIAFHRWELILLIGQIITVARQKHILFSSVIYIFAM